MPCGLVGEEILLANGLAALLALIDGTNHGKHLKSVARLHHTLEELATGTVLIHPCNRLNLS